MKYLKSLFVLLLGTFFIVSCSNNPVEQSPQGTARFVLHVHDKPLPTGAEHLYLDITEVSIHKAEDSNSDDSEQDDSKGASDQSGWITLSETDTVIDFLDLVNGKTAVLTDTTLESGKYTQLRLLLNYSDGHENAIVINGQEHQLRVPSGAQTGVKLNLDLELQPDELVEVFVDFNAEKSIHYVPGHDAYFLRPSFHAMMKDVSGTVSGIVQDVDSNPVENATVRAIMDDDTTSTVTDAEGEYELRLKAATYDSIEAVSESADLPDVVYKDVTVESGDKLTGYDFTPDAVSTNGSGKIMVQAFDSPLPANVSEANLHVKQISVYKDVEDDEGSGWIVLANPDSVINFLALINGEKVTLVDTILEPGNYTQMRLLLGEDNHLVFDNESTADLFVPSGMQSGVKINLHFAVEPDQSMNVYLDFNAAKSIRYNRGREDWMMRPTFHAFKEVLSGSVAGTVTDTAGTSIEDVFVYAEAGEDTVASTKTDAEGEYLLILPSGTYTLSAAADGYSETDTSYADTSIEPMDELTEYNFMLTPEESGEEEGS